VDKVWFFLLVTSPYLGFFGWLGWWLVTDALRERKRVLAVVRELCDERRDVARPVDGAA
jgi:hypothetical protein